jgi:hypothetical protein
MGCSSRLRLSIIEDQCLTREGTRRVLMPTTDRAVAKFGDGLEGHQRRPAGDDRLVPLGES